MKNSTKIFTAHCGTECVAVEIRSSVRVVAARVWWWYFKQLIYNIMFDLFDLRLASFTHVPNKLYGYTAKWLCNNL